MQLNKYTKIRVRSCEFTMRNPSSVLKISTQGVASGKPSDIIITDHRNTQARSIIHSLSQRVQVSSLSSRISESPRGAGWMSEERLSAITRRSRLHQDEEIIEDYTVECCSEVRTSPRGSFRWRVPCETWRLADTRVPWREEGRGWWWWWIEGRG